MAKPVTVSERIIDIDIIRGFALFGVLLINIISFNMPPFGALELYEPFSSVDSVLEMLIKIIIEGKFYSIFSILFGLGFALQISRLKDKGAPHKKIFIRRLFILFIIGTIHSVLVYDGDILKVYALIGLVLFLFHASKNRKIWKYVLILLSIFYLVIIGAFVVKGVKAADKSHEEIVETRMHRLNELQEEYEPFLSDSYLAVTKKRTEMTFSLNGLGILAYGLIYILPLFLIGALIGRSDLFKKTTTGWSQLKKLFKWSLIIGLTCALVYFTCWLKANPEEEGMLESLKKISAFLSNLSLGLTYMSGIILLLRKKLFQRILSPLAYVGRMALTNYLMQSIIFTFIFYGYGFGLMGQKSFSALIAATVVFYIIQIVYSKFWLAHFNFGPFEWLWRSLTYNEIQPFRQRNRQDSSVLSPVESSGKL